MSLLRRAVPLEDQVALDRLLDDAFAPARTRTAGISAARVRARVAWEKEVPVGRGWRAVSLLGRLGEVSLALGMTAILFAGSPGGLSGQTGSVRTDRGSEYVVRVTSLLDESRLVRLLRLGRAVAVVDDFDPATSLAPMAEAGGLVRLLREQGGLPGAAPWQPVDDDDHLTIPAERQAMPR